MSLLKSLKGTFQNVQQDIVDGFRALSALDSTTHQRKVLQLEARGISVDAGADLLYKYHKNWSEMQSYSADTAVIAEKVDQMLRVLLTEWERRGQSANRLEEEVATLPTIASTLKDMQEVIESLCEDFRAVEEEMEKLQDVAEEEGLRQEQLSHHAQLAAYVKSRQAEASAVKGKLWKKLKEKSKELESQNVQSMGRGQSVITEMDHLSPPRSHSVSEETLQPNNSSSRNVGADQFHSAQYGPVSSDEGDQGDLSAGEEAFIEDDYTLDYSATMHHDDLFPDLDEDVPIDFDGVCGADSPAAQDLSECRDACREDTVQSAEDSGQEGEACEGVSTEEEKA